IKGKRHVDLTVDPPPDLAIEVEITRSALNRLGVYAGLGVGEVWRFDGEVMTVMLLGPDRAYAESATSAVFPFLPMDEIARFLRDDEGDDANWGRTLRAWVRGVIVPKVVGGQGERID
ncbi:MAG: Uma2 family endonuclease, partial [Planctomycetia bacterium]|nr:Uma2 family endonuclease [Planctomycetia bacterium]